MCAAIGKLCVNGASYDPDKACLLGTRKGILDEIITWATQPLGSSAEIFWLSGVAGSGKSAIANAVATIFSNTGGKDGRLGSAFFFDQAYAETRNAVHLFGTISGNLANSDPCWKSVLNNVLKKTQNIVHSSSVTLHYNTFLLEVANHADMTVIGPYVIIIDGLDECKSDQVLLNILRRRISELPSNFRFLITSRPNSEIASALNKHTTRKMEDLHQTFEDVQKYIETQLASVFQKDHWWSNTNIAQKLANASEGSFQWAATMCMLVRQPPGGVPYKEQLNRILKFSKVKDVPLLSNLYLGIFSQVFTSSHAEDQTNITNILGTIVVAKTPLSISSIKELWMFKNESSANAVQSILTPLSSLLSGVSDVNTPIQPMHTSIWEFLRDEQASGRFSVDHCQADGNLQDMCLEIMKRSLRFNICEIPTSYLENKEIPGLEEKIAQNVSAGLQYACKYWTDHLEKDNIMDAHTIASVKDIMNEKLLYWLEVMSLLDSISDCYNALNKICDWIKVRDNTYENVFQC